MLKIIKMLIIGTLFFSGTAFAHGWGRHHHGYGYGPGYGYGYGPGYGVYAPPAMGYYPIQQPYYAPPPVAPYGGYAYGVSPVVRVPFFGGGWGHGRYGHHGHR